MLDFDRLRPRSAGRAPVALAAAILLAAVALRCVRRDELHCENAVAQLESCCPEFRPDAGYCEYAEGCGVVYPTISEGDAECIVGLTCGEIVAGGICERAQTAVPRTDSQPGTDLCP